MHVLVFQRKPCMCLMNRLNSLKPVQHVGAHNLRERKGKKERKYSVYNFWEYAQHSK